MPSTYSSLALELMATGEKNNAWGTITNSNLELLEEAIAGVAEVTLGDADVTLALVQGLTSPSRHFVLRAVTCVHLTTIRNFYLQAGVQKPYVIVNDTSGGQSLHARIGATQGVTIENGQSAFLYSNGVSVKSVTGPLATLTLITAQYIATGAITASALATGAVTASAIGTSAVLASAIGLGAVTASAIAAGALTSAAFGVSSIPTSAYQAGSINTSALANGAVTPAKTSGMPFTSAYDSGLLTITVGGSVSLTHGFSNIPTFATYEYQCVSADAGWTAGQVWQAGPDFLYDGSASRMTFLAKSSTGLFVQFNSTGFYVPTYGTGNLQAGSASAWNIRVRAWI